MKHRLFVKIVVWILAIIMILGCCTAILSAFVTPTYAAEPAIGEEYVTVGLMYGSDVTVGFETVTTVGFRVYSVTATRTERSFEEIFSINLPKVSVVCDDNLSQTSYTYSIYDTTKKCVVGGYHVEVAEDFATRKEAEDMLSFVKEALINEGSDMHPFIAYIHGAYKIRIGDYSSVERIESKIASVPKLASEVKLVCAQPSKTCVMVVDPETNVIYFEYDDGGDNMLGLAPMPKDGEKQYLRTPAGRLYDGIFVYERYVKDKVDGIELVNILPLEDYIAGVVPYEISPDWPFEALSAFAITVRGYTVKNFNRHYSAYGFDICNTTHCQVYRGIGSANDAVFEAVALTEGMVLTNGKEVASTYYSSSMGGYTASSKDTWGGSDSEYLVPTYTPWERYSEHNNGLWQSQVSGKELGDYLRQNGHNFSGDVADIEITGYSGDSPYVYSLTFTSTKGDKLVISRCDKVRSSVSKYVRSANFVVGKGTLTYSYDDVEEINFDSTYSFTTGNYSPIDEEPRVLSADGVFKLDEKKVYTIESGGESRAELSSKIVATGESGFYYDLYSTPAVTLVRRTKTITADENTFIFAGKGWGHGVGISQYGTLDLANAGATAEQILNLYFPELYICDYSEIDSLKLPKAFTPAEPSEETSAPEETEAPEKTEVPIETTAAPDETLPPEETDVTEETAETEDSEEKE